MMPIPQIDWNLFCCADPNVGGCSHPRAAGPAGTGGHTGQNNSCTETGCNCPGFTPHPPTCIHLNPDPPVNLTG
jgi:hypothetical protein